MSFHLDFLRLLNNPTSVKKTAQERKDKLGPHWGHWVAKAINKLVRALHYKFHASARSDVIKETDGILEAEKSTGHLTLTPNGKKAYAVCYLILKASSC